MSSIGNEILLEESEDYYSEDLYNITSWGADISFRELITMYEENELLKPEFQRNYVWEKTEASRFIESLLMGLPVPSIFLAKMENEKRLIIDGYQRIMTVFDYVKKGTFKDGKVFKLSNSHVINERWRGKAFSEIDEVDKRKIRNTTIHAIIFEQKSPRDNDTSLYQVFERINTSGRALTPQEIRNCVYQGSFNTLLLKLNKHQSWRTLYGSTTEDARMKDIEQILRFFTLGSYTIKKSEAVQISLKKELNIFMGSSESKSPKELVKRKDIFTKTMDYILLNFGENAFHNITSKESLSRFNPTTFDAIAIATAYALGKNPTLTINNAEKKRISLLNNDEFKNLTSERTTNISNINGRISLALKYLFEMSYE